MAAARSGIKLYYRTNLYKTETTNNQGMYEYLGDNIGDSIESGEERSLAGRSRRAREGQRFGRVPFYQKTRGIRDVKGSE